MNDLDIRRKTYGTVLLSRVPGGYLAERKRYNGSYGEFFFESAVFNTLTGAYDWFTDYFCEAVNPEEDSGEEGIPFQPGGLDPLDSTSIQGSVQPDGEDELPRT